MADVATYKLWLVDAEKALQDIMTGKKAKVFVDQNGERIEYNTATVGQLQKYIAWLNYMIETGGTLSPSGPLKVWM